MKLMILFSLVPILSFGMDRLSALSMIETGDDDTVVGKAGEISRYQVLKSEWKTITISTNYSDPNTAREVALKLLERRLEKFEVQFDRSATDFEFYALWNAPAQVLSGRISPTVAERSQRFVNLCARQKQVSSLVCRRSF
jgi:hypothetical protein